MPSMNSISGISIMYSLCLSMVPLLEAMKPIFKGDFVRCNNNDKNETEAFHYCYLSLSFIAAYRSSFTILFGVDDRVRPADLLH
jgi:hypothetical protein